jgi:hypothetical protein
MNTDLTDLVHESIAQLTDGERIPADLAQRAARRNHLRRTALGAATVTGVATIATAATLVAATATGGVPPRGGGLPPAQTTAYVLGHTERAMTAAEGKLIEEIHAVGRHHTWYALGEDNGQACVEEVSPVRRQLPCPKDLNEGLASDAAYLSYREQFRETGYSAAGRMLWDAGVARTATPSGGQTFAAIGVDYLSKTWWSITTPADDGIFQEKPPTGCGLLRGGIAAPIGNPTGWDAQIRNALRCGTFRVAGSERIGGVNTIKIIAVKRDQRPYTLWVSPSTYLPVRADNGWLAGDFQWLAPTKANLAAFHVRVPEAFRRVRATGVPVIAFAHG